MKVLAMYSRRKVDARLDIAEAEFGFRPAPRPIPEVIDFESHLIHRQMYTYDQSGRPEAVQNLTQWERDWILNEQLMVLCDAMYALTRYCFIKEFEHNEIIRFAPRIPQRLIYDIIADLEDRDSAIELMILKARQLGVSTVIELLVALRIIFGHGVNAVIGSADQTKTALMANMVFLMYDYLPVWLRPPFTRRVESDRGMLVFGVSASGVSFQHGAQASGIARGTTPTIYHLSECASFTNPLQQIEASLFRAVHASPSVFGTLESTGEGDKGWWPDTWRSSKADWEDGRARLCPVFLPWFCGTHIWPTETWARMHPVPSGWHPHPETREHVAKSELYVRSSDLLKRHLGERWRMPPIQQWFWEVEHEEAKSKGPDVEAVFFQEMAGDDEEALQRSATSVFGHQTILTIDDQRERQYDMYAIVGQNIEQDHEPRQEDINYSAERIPVRYTHQAGGVTFRWELVPLKFDPPPRETERDDINGVLLIWRHPEPGIRYSIGMDTSEGKGEDGTCISVWALGYGDNPDVQVAEYTSAYVSHVESFAFIMPIAAYYKSVMDPEKCGGWREPYVAIEQVQSVGDVAQVQMARMGYHHFHMFCRYDGKNPALDKRKSRKRGVFTWSWFRPILTGNFVHWARNFWARINSPWLIEEMKTFEVKVTATGKEKMEHEEGEHDDRIFAAAMACFCPHDLDPMSQRTKRRMVEEESLPSIDLTPVAGTLIRAADVAAAQTPVATIEDLMYSQDRMERFR
jgi:hypothetical protein